MRSGVNWDVEGNGVGSADEEGRFVKCRGGGKMCGVG